MMKVTVLQENLHKALSFVSKVVSQKTQLPILSNILLKTKNGRLQLSGTNLETSISYWLGAAVEKEGEITVPARLFNELVASFPQDKVELRSEQNILFLQSAGSEATLSGIAASEFPPLPEIQTKKDATLEMKLLEKSLSFVLSSVSTDEGRPLLTGIRFAKKEGKTLMVATDGYRLSIKELPLIAGLGDGFVVSARALEEAHRLATEEKAATLDLYLSQDKNQIMLVAPNVHISTRLIEGEYPNYEKIIPASFTTRAIFKKDELLRATKLASVYAKESANILRVALKTNQAIISANTPQIGENKSEIEIEFEGNEGEIAFNARFVLDLLSVFPEDEVVLEMSGPLAPGVFRPLKDQSYLYIIMPVRVQG